MKILSTDHLVTSIVQLGNLTYRREYDSRTGIIGWFYHSGKVKCSPPTTTALEQAYLKAEKNGTADD